jgi:subtilisin-like proprotein convertase family protein
MQFSWSGLVKALGAFDYSFGGRLRWSGGRRQARGRARFAALLNEVLEPLESRLLLSTLPLPNITGYTTVTGGTHTPSVAVDPMNSDFAVAVSSATTSISGAYTTNGGTSWTAFAVPGQITDPTTGGLFAQATDPSVAFDRNENFYVVESQHSGDNSTGAIVISKWSVANNAVTASGIQDQVVYEWVQDPAYTPMVAVDNNAPTFTDSQTHQTVTDALSGMVYAAWSTQNIAPTNAANFNPNTIRVVGSANGGTTFTAQNFANIGANFGTDRDTAPQLVVSQGTSSGRVAPGQLSIVWDNWGGGNLATGAILDGGAAAAFGALNQNVPITDALPASADLFTQPAPTQAVGANPTSIVSGDFTGNGHAGFAVYGGGHITIYGNDGAGNFTQSGNPLNVANVTYLASGDFNGDGVDDIAYLVAGSNNVYVSLDNGGQLQAPTAYGTGSGPVSIAIGDVNLDGVADIITSDQSEGDINVLINKADKTGTFVQGAKIGGMAGASNVATGDFNNDGQTDIAVSTANGIYVVMNNSSISGGVTTFSLSSTGVKVGGGAPGQMVVGDFNGDAKPDIAYITGQGFQVILDTTGQGASIPSFGGASGTYTSAGEANQVPSAIVAGDFDGSGTLDVLLVDSANNIATPFLGNGNGTFTTQAASANFPVGTTPVAAAANLLNGDKKLDVLVANGGSGNVTEMLTVLNPTQTPQTTTVTQNVPANDAQWTQMLNGTNMMGAIDNLEVTIGIQHSSTSDLGVVLTAPDGVHSITLVDQSTQGANFGSTASGIYLGTTFDDRAPRNITDPNADGTSYTGHFSAQGGSLLTFLKSLNGGNLPTSAQVTGDWTLKITDNANSGISPVQFAKGVELRFSSHLTAPGANHTVASPTLAGAETGPYATKIPADPSRGIGPSFSVAQDNTLGSFSPYQGRMYVAYTTQPNAAANASNTDIYMATSDDGGTTWTVRVDANGNNTINDDNAVLDGFSSGGVNNSIGRSQFMPSVAVDQTTGTMAISFYDARYDAANARVAQFFGTSLDGGATFSQETYLNQPNSATDGITGTTHNLEPSSDNQSTGNPGRDSTFAFGDRQTLAVASGHVYALWSGNQNSGSERILSAAATISTGPRAVTGDMGPVTADFTYTTPGDTAATTYNTAGTTTTYNNEYATDGTRELTGFVVVFDRPVDPASFTAGNVAVTFTPADNTVSTPNLTIGVITPLDLGTWGPAHAAGLATTFLVNFATPVSAVGSYSYSIGNTVRDKIRLANASGVQISLGNTMDQNGDAGTNTSNDYFKVPTPSADGAGFDTATSPLIVAGPHIVNMYVPGNPITLNQQTSNAEAQANLPGAAIDVTLPAAIDPALFTTAAVLRILGPAGTPLKDTLNNTVMDSAGNLTGYTVPAPVGNTPTDTFEIDLPTLQNGEVYPAGPFTVYLASTVDPSTVSGVTSSNGNVGSGVSLDTENLVLNSTVSTLNVVFDRDMNPASFTTADILRLTGPLGQIKGPFTVTANPAGTPVALAKRTFAIGIPTQTLSGTYVIQLASSMTSAVGQQNPAGLQMDANFNAGLDQAIGNVPTGTPTTATVYANPTSTVVGTDSMITVPDSFVIPNEVNGGTNATTVQLSITYPNDPDLTAVLIAPNGKSITLFSGVGANAANKSNFANTILSDQATVSIASGSAPFFSSFTPAQALDGLAGINVKGTWILRVTSSSAAAGTINAWSLTFQKPILASDLGQAVADQTSGGFRIFTEDTSIAQSSTQFTALGGASLNSGDNSGRVGGLAVDPSDPSGNTVYVGGASGGVWKTTNFLTSDSRGPTYIPITDIGPAFSLNIGSIAVFPRNNDTNQSILLVGTGEGDTSSGGAGFLRSEDGGATWTVLDSTTNVDATGAVLPMNSGVRDHIFVGMSTYKVVVDPTLSSGGGVVAYAALSTGLWRTLDSGGHWALMRAGDCTDVVLDPNSDYTDAVTGKPGNDQYIYAAFAGDGVYASPNQGQVWNEMLGGLGNPLVISVDNSTATSVPVNGGATPNGALGRIDLAKPVLTGNPSVDIAYQGWLYALVAQPSGHYNGLYLTKDFGKNWTLVHTPNVANGTGTTTTVEGSVGFAAIPTNDTGQGNLDIFGAQGNYDMSLGIDPNNPNVVYLGGSADFSPSGLIRVDTTGLVDGHALFQSDARPDGGTMNPNVNDGIALTNTAAPYPTIKVAMQGTALTLATQPYGPVASNAVTPGQYINFATVSQDPQNPFLTDSQIYVTNIAHFGNTGSGATWTPMDTNTGIIGESTDQHRIVTFVDPLTGRTRLIMGDDQGVWSGVDNGDGTANTGFQTTTDQVTGLPSANPLTTTLYPMGVTANPLGSRNGNLQITQQYYGASQPSQLAADLASALFYANTQDNGQVMSDPNILSNGNLNWVGPDGDGQGVGADQTGTGTSYWYNWPCCGGGNNNFFQVTPPGTAPGTSPVGIGRTFGLIQQNNPGVTPDPQWPLLGGVNFTVNPINGNQIVISSTTGNIFLTANQGRVWQQIGEGASFNDSNAYALTFGAPNPADGTNAPQDDFIYAGTDDGHIYVTFDGGGANGNDWTSLSTGLDGSGVRAISASPYRGSHAVFAVTKAGVYYMADSSAANATWTNITSNVFALTQNPFQDASLQEAKLGASTLNALAVDWRYHNLTDINDQTGVVHPVVYIGGEGGVFRSTNVLDDAGNVDPNVAWSVFPNVGEGAVIDGGLLPNANITTLNLELGNIDPSSGLPISGGGVDMLVVSTYGRGTFGIRVSQILNTGPKLAFANQPSNVMVGAVLPPITVNVENFQGNILGSDTSTVTLALVGAPAGVTLGGTTSVQAVNGVATFSDLTVSAGGTYAFVATDGTVTKAVSDSFTITPVPATQLQFSTAAQHLVPGATSGLMTVELLTAGNVVTQAGVGGVTVNLSSSSVSGSFFDTNGNPVTSITIINGQSTASFRYVDTAAGTPTITAASNGLTSALQQETVELQVAFSTAPKTLFAGVLSSAISLTLEDNSGNATPAPTGGETIALSSSSSTGIFQDLLGNVITSVTAPAGSSTVSFKYIDSTIGTPTVSATVAGLSPVTQQETVQPSAPTQLAFTTAPLTNPGLAAGAVSPVITVALEDQFGNPTSLGTSLVVHLTTTSSTGEFISATTGQVTFTATITAGNSSASFKYRDTALGTPTLTASASGYTPATQQELVQPGPAAKIVFLTSPFVVTVGSAIAVTVELTDAYGNVAVAPNNGTLISLQTSSSGGSFLTTQNALITSLLIPAGSSTATFQYSDMNIGSPTLTVSSLGLTTATQVESVQAAPPTTPLPPTLTQLVFTSAAQSLSANAVSGALTLVLDDQYGNAINAGVHAVVINLSTTSAGGSFQDAVTGLPITSIQMVHGTNTVYVRYVDTVPGTPTLTASSPNLISATQQETVALSKNEILVNNLYNQLLGRAAEPTQSGLFYWSGRLDHGEPLSVVADGIATSVEYDTDVVSGIYQQYLHRAADPTGLAAWVGQMQAGTVSYETIRGYILGSQEFANDMLAQYPDYVTGLYQTLLGRAPDAGGLAFWTQILGTLTPNSPDSQRDPVSIGISTSFEQSEDYVTAKFQQFLNRAPSAALPPSLPDANGVPAPTSPALQGEQGFWADALNHGTTDGDFIADILSSNEYLQLHGLL